MSSYYFYFYEMIQIQIKATPSVSGTNANRKSKRLSNYDNSTFKGMTMPPRVPFEPTNKDKMCFKAITFMKVDCSISGFYAFFCFSFFFTKMTKEK